MYKFIGVQHREYVSKKTGKNVNGFNLFLGKERNDTIGVMPCVKPFWLSDTKFNEFDVGSFVPGVSLDVSFNEYGNITSIRMA